METFAPEANGWKLQRGYQIVPRWAVVEDERELGNVRSTAVAEKEIRRFRGRYIAATREAIEYLESFFRRHVGSAGRFFYAWPEFVASPDAAPTLETVVSGSQGSRTVFVRFAWKNSVGLTRAGPAGSLAIPANSLLRVTLPPYPPSVSQAVIYATQGAAGTEVEQITLTDQRIWTQTNAPLQTGTAAPETTNTARETPVSRLIADSLSYVRGAGVSYEAQLELEEVY